METRQKTSTLKMLATLPSTSVLGEKMMAPLGATLMVPLSSTSVGPYSFLGKPHRASADVSVGGIEDAMLLV